MALRKRGGNFFNSLQKEGGTQKGGEGFPQKIGWWFNPGGNYANFLRKFLLGRKCAKMAQFFCLSVKPCLRNYENTSCNS